MLGHRKDQRQHRQEREGHSHRLHRQSMKGHMQGKESHRSHIFRESMAGNQEGRSTVEVMGLGAS
ncbi:hypothetical protein ACSBR2_025266 [Camellia fascicularis]